LCHPETISRTKPPPFDDNRPFAFSSVSLRVMASDPLKWKLMDRSHCHGTTRDKTNQIKTMPKRLFNASSHGTLMAGYDAWAETYDRDVQDFGYATPDAVADAVCRHFPERDARLLDLGAGTGLLGEKLYGRGYRHLVGMDGSHGMLTQACRKGTYRLLCRMALGRPLGFPDHYFDGLLAAGVYTPGHAPPDSLFELSRILRPGGIIIFSLKWDGKFKEDFLAILQQMTDTAGWRCQSWSAAYRSWPWADETQEARVLVYKQACRP
jgi:SAM-dependent methyltransferase